METLSFERHEQGMRRVFFVFFFFLNDAYVFLGIFIVFGILEIFEVLVCEL